MHRNIDTIVAAHGAATARRQAGQPIWAGRLDLKGVMDHDDPNPIEAAGVIADRVRSAPWFDDSDLVLASVVDEFETLSDCGSGEDVDEFNEIMSAFYDWCDVTGRIWVETF